MNTSETSEQQSPAPVLVQPVVSRPVCTDCKHCMTPAGPDWKNDWKLLFIPIVGWLILFALSVMDKTSWCCVGMRLAGNTDDNPGIGKPCWKMRTQGACGPAARLFEAKMPDEKGQP